MIALKIFSYGQRLRFMRRQKKLLRRLKKIKGLKNRGSKREKVPFKIFSAVTEFGLYNHSRNDLIAFVRRIKKYVVDGGRKILIDFTHTKKFNAEGTLYFYAEIDRLLDCFRGLKIKCEPPLNNRAAQVLQQIGFYSRIGSSHQAICSDDSVVNWRAARGQGALGEKYDEILGSYDGHITSALSGELYTGLTEAMTNAHHHAYLAPRGDGVRVPANYKPWWMFSQERDGLLTVVFCDLGIGIPGSLPRNKDEGWQKWWTIWKRLGFHKRGDSWLIRGAVRHSRTRTELQHRGKGLRQIIETVSAIPSGKAIILSNKGWYSISNGEETYDDRRVSIDGTVLFWQLPLSEPVNLL
jgi:hypothetical protein